MKTPSIFLSKNISNEDKEVTEVLYNKQKLNIDPDESSEEPLNTTQLSTLKAFEQLRLSFINKINHIINNSKTLDPQKVTESISWWHKLLFNIGCLKPSKKEDSDDLDTVYKELTQNSKNVDKYKAYRRLYRNQKLVRKGLAKLSHDLDIVNVVSAIRKINNLTNIMLTNNQYSMLMN